MPQCNILLCGHPVLDAVYTVCFELVGPLHLHDAVTYSVATSATTYMLFCVQLLCRVLGPYLNGGGAKSLDFQSLSQDLIRTSMQIPFSVPPYMSLLARSTATLEGIALLGDPNYQMVSQVC